MTTSNIEKLKHIAELLKRSSKVSNLSDGEHDEAWTLAHALSDVEGSFKEIYEKILPKLAEGSPTEEQIEDLLLDIGEELRHVIYHVQDCRYFDYLFGEVEE